MAIKDLKDSFACDIDSCRYRNFCNSEAVVRGFLFWQRLLARWDLWTKGIRRNNIIRNRCSRYDISRSTSARPLVLEENSEQPSPVACELDVESTSLSSFIHSLAISLREESGPKVWHVWTVCSSPRPMKLAVVHRAVRSSRPSPSAGSSVSLSTQSISRTRTYQES